MSHYSISPTPQELRANTGWREDGHALMEFAHQNETGRMKLVFVFQGVLLCFNDFHMHTIPNEDQSQVRRLLINYCEEGRCEVNLGDNGYVYVDRGCLSVDVHGTTEAFVCPTGRYKGIEYILNLDELSESMPSAFTELGIDPLVLADTLCRSLKSFLIYTPENIKAIFQSISDAPEEQVTFHRLKTLELFYALQRMDMSAVKNRKTWLTNGQAMIAKEIYAGISKNPQLPVNISERARQFGVSATSARNYFQSIYGESIAAVLRRTRMDHAADMLKESDLSVAEIASAVGYENQSKFAAAFREFTGDPPLEYRRKVRCASAAEK